MISLPYIFLRHSKLDLPYKRHEDMPFSVLVDLGNDKHQASIDEGMAKGRIAELSKKIPFQNISTIITSDQLRARQTGEILLDQVKEVRTEPVGVRVSDQIREIVFNLDQIYGGVEPETVDLHEIIQKVFGCMVSGDFCESVSQTIQRIEAFAKDLQLQEHNGQVMIITHGFFMRVLELALVKQFSKEDITIEALHKEARRNSYLEGFATDLNGAIEYID